MPKRILIDATHAEETRVVVLENGRVQEFDSETSVKKQLKGNIYLAKITRVEPSLQSAFVDYGGDKHGFLPFSEIHPDYYNIPVSDKAAILKSIRDKDKRANDEASPSNNGESGENGDDKETSADEDVEVLENDEEDPSNVDYNIYKKYKIQEVIKTHQIVLIQVDKEERGNKGASLTTFISLAGKYCVLMPKSLRQGGVSRRIGSIEDRKRLKSVIASLKLPDEIGLIIRTAGSSRNEKEIKTDYDYLMKLWNDIRTLTMSSTAPAFIHAEDALVKRTVRDLYDDDVDEILIEGDGAFSDAKDFMKIVLPAHVGKVKKYKNKVPIFTRYRVEEQIAALYSHEAPLESGGSIVINPTEALISIDVNSGRSTSSRNVEETAVSTNLEAAKEVARQLRLRDLSGLIVIDFIDMLELRNRKNVERVLKDAFASDRAKIQLGRISTFGLLEMSRQRLSSSFLEVNTMVCPHCSGTGVVKATESTAVTVLRAIENEVSRGRKCDGVEVSVSAEVAIYILNHKRNVVSRIEERYDVKIVVRQDLEIEADGFFVEKFGVSASRDNVEDSEETETSTKAKVKKPARKEEGSVVEFPKQAAKEDVIEKSKGGKSRTEVSLVTVFGGIWKKIID